VCVCVCILGILINNDYRDKCVKVIVQYIAISRLPFHMVIFCHFVGLAAVD